MVITFFRLVHHHWPYAVTLLVSASCQFASFPTPSFSFCLKLPDNNAKDALNFSALWLLSLFFLHENQDGVFVRVCQQECTCPLSLSHVCIALAHLISKQWLPPLTGHVSTCSSCICVRQFYSVCSLNLAYQMRWNRVKVSERKCDAISIADL